MSHIFISYSRKDIGFAQKIVDALAENNLDTWIDWKSIPKGEDWENEIYQGIESAEAFLFLVSHDSVESEMCNKEIAHALGNGKRILPILIRDANVEKFLFESVKEEISKRNWIFCRDGQDDFDKAIMETRDAIHTDYEWIKYHTRLQVKALEWERANDNSWLLRGKALLEAEEQLLANDKDPQPTVLQREFIIASRRYEVSIDGERTLSSKIDSSEDESLKIFMDWSIENNATFSIPNLNVSPPISKAWAQLSVISSKETDADQSELPKLEKLISNYREWYESTSSRYTFDSIKVEKVVHQNRKLVIVAGPGAGKSTLLRRLAWSLLQDGHLIIRVSLRKVALRVRNGESFDEAIYSTVLDGFVGKSLRLMEALNDCEYLLADGLDEAGDYSLRLSEDLKKWAVARPSSKVVVTTRPIGYNPSWLSGWSHYKLLPLEQKNVSDFVSIIFSLLYSGDEDLVEKKKTVFSAELENSKIAKAAVRNPQLLGFLLSLFINGQKLDGNRSHLFEKIVEDIRKQTRLDKEFTVQVEKSVANYVIKHLGFLLLDRPDATENYLEKEIGSSLEQLFGIAPLNATQKVVDALRFWEERGLIERLAIGLSTVFVFIHTAFQEFLAAQHLVQFSDKKLNAWVVENFRKSRYRETISLLGATNKLDLVIDTLLSFDDINDPVSITPILILSVFAESENITQDLVNKTLEPIFRRLTSNIPSIVDETVSALLPLAELSPSLIGPIALKLSTHKNVWVVEGACVLGLIAGDKYINLEALLSVFLIASEYSRAPSTDGFGLEFRDHIRILIIKGGQYLIKHKPSKFKKIVLERYDDNFSMSMGTLTEFESLLRLIFSFEEMSNLTKWRWGYEFPDIDEMDKRHRAEWRLMLNATLKALQIYRGEKTSIPDKYLGSFSLLISALDFGETPASDMPLLLKRGISDELVEVIRGAIIVSDIDPLQLWADTEKALSLIADYSIKAIDVISVMGMKIDVDINWALIKKSNTNLDLLLQAILHPVWFVCRFAALLLLEFADVNDVKSGLKIILKDAPKRTIKLIALIAHDIWKDDAGEIVLQHLESNLTSKCAPLVKVLGDIMTPALNERAMEILLKSLRFEDVAIVKASIYSIEKLNIFDQLHSDIKVAYEWWLYKGPQDPSETGVVPENAAKSLFECLNLHQGLDVSDIKIAAKSKRSDVRDVAVRAVCNLCTQDEKLFASILFEVEHGDLPIKIIDEFEKSQISFCALHVNDFLQLLNSENLRVKNKIVRLLDNQAMKTELVEKKLRSLLESPEIELRDSALHSLRKLMYDK